MVFFLPCVYPYDSDVLTKSLLNGRPTIQQENIKQAV